MKVGAMNDYEREKRIDLEGHSTELSQGGRYSDDLLQKDGSQGCPEEQ